MKKTILTCLLGFTLALTVNAQKSKITRFKAGDVELSAGIGLLPTFLADQAQTIIPPVGLRLGYRVSENFSLAGFVSYSSSETDRISLPDGTINKWENNYTMVGLRGAVHATRIQNWDIYGGFMAAYNITDVNRTIVDHSNDDIDFRSPYQPTNSDTFTFGGFVGGAYYFKKNLAVFGELGYGVSLVNAGVTLKF